MMSAHRPFWKAQKQRGHVLKLARDLARSGQHTDHMTIAAELELALGLAEVRRCLTERPIAAQLDRLCSMASSGRPCGSLSVFLAQFREEGKHVSVQRDTRRHSVAM